MSLSFHRFNILIILYNHLLLSISLFSIPSIPLYFPVTPPRSVQTISRHPVPTHFPFPVLFSTSSFFASFSNTLTLLHPVPTHCNFSLLFHPTSPHRSVPIAFLFPCHSQSSFLFRAVPLALSLYSSLFFLITLLPSFSFIYLPPFPLYFFFLNSFCPFI